MLTLRVVQAHFGDCLLLVHGNQDKYMLVDGGPANTFAPHLQAVLSNIKPNRLDVVCLSHVDTDHTTGLQDLLAELRDATDDNDPLLVSIGDFWINEFGTTIDADNKKRDVQLANILQAVTPAGSMHLASDALSGIKHGHGLVLLAKQLGITINNHTQGQPWLSGKINAFQHHDLDITVVGPTEKNLARLRREWDDWIEDQEERIKNGDLNAAIKADTSMPNLSSIQLLVKCNNKTLLLTGDGRGDHLISALEEADLLDDEGDFEVDVLKLPHHGSARNVTADFFERVRAKTYVISANGRDDNPDTATLSWMVAAAKKQKRTFDLVITNMPEHVVEFIEKHPGNKNNYTLHKPKANAHFIDVLIAQ